MEMGNRIKRLREEKGMTLEELGDKVGVGKSTVRKWETGMIANMKRDKISKLADALGVSPGYLMGWESPEPDEAEDLMDILGDRKLMKYMSMVKEMDDTQKEQVYSYIEFISTKK